ncbi:MAG TPA: L17 family ribosomal protein [Candidatus Dojkabacteria bacterium]|nr:L17 family ribosomal protein [Candidatus Dojkabacteria bacterium]
MYKRKSIKKLGRTASHRKALIKNQLRSVLSTGKIKTSTVKAKVLKGELESMFNNIKKSKENDINLIRQLKKILGSDELVKKAIELGKKDGVKVTIKKVGFRDGDNTEMSVVEIEGFKTEQKKEVKKGKKKEEKEEKQEELENVIEQKKVEEKKKGILNLGRKPAVQKTAPVKKERVRTRSGL